MSLWIKLKTFFKKDKASKINSVSTPNLRILSLDGGGIRGLIEAEILNVIEQRTGKHTTELFDMLAGTSTGGIIALALNKKGQDDKPEFWAKDLVNLYLKESESIFKSRLPKRIQVVAKLAEEKYSHDSLQDVLFKYLGNSKQKDGILPIVLLAYDLTTREPFIFSSFNPDLDFEAALVGRATSAAPSYFKPCKIQFTKPESSKTEIRYLIDGGVVANNPAFFAYYEAKKNLIKPGHGCDMISIGTGYSPNSIDYDEKNAWGEVAWIQPLIDITFQNLSHLTDLQLQTIFTDKVGQNYKYYRLQPKLKPELSSMDNSSPENLHKLQKLAHQFIQQHTQEIDEICEKLITKL